MVNRALWAVRPKAYFYTVYQHSLHSMYVCVMFHNVSALLLHAWVTIWPLAPSALAKRRHSLKGEIGPK